MVSEDADHKGSSPPSSYHTEQVFERPYPLMETSGASVDVLTQETSGANAAWSRTFQLPPSTPIQYKFLKKGAVADVWERNQSTASGNREVTTAACGQPTQVLDAGSFAF